MNFFLLIVGLGFILIDFAVQGYDILPDVIGYIMLAIGLMPLTNVNPHFRRARNVSLLMIVIGVLTFITPVRSFVIEMANIAILSVLLSIAIYVIELVFMYSILMGIAELARSNREHSLSVRAMLLWKYYWILIVVSFFGTILAFFLGILGVLLIIGFGIATIVLAYMILKMVYDSKSILTIK